MIQMIAVESSNVESVGHDGNETLRVQFKRGAPYDYRPVQADEFQKILVSSSPGGMVIAIKGRAGVTCIKVTS